MWEFNSPFQPVQGCVYGTGGDPLTGFLFQLPGNGY
jgi:hypothetical protein